MEINNMSNEANNIKAPEQNRNPQSAPAQKPRVDAPNTPPYISAQRDVKTPETSTKKPLIAELIATALRYNDVKFTEEKREDDIVYNWEDNSNDDKIIYEIVIHKDSTFFTSAKVNSINTTRTLKFNNKDESQNIVAHAINNLKKNNANE